MSAPEVVVHADADALATAAAARLVAALSSVQRAKGSVSVVLTGGGTGISVLRAVRAAASTLDWSRVDVYWGDERFLPAGHADRNETQAREALLDHVAVDPARVHPMAPSDGDLGDDPDAAAAAYAELLGDSPVFDVLLLGVGEEGHTLSVFPDSPAVHSTEPVVAVRDCPKPPPTRISLTLPTARLATQVWLMATGAGKAGPVGAAVSGVSEVDIPAAGARGVEATVWFLDEAAAAKTARS
ncbi:6-phosphogluconolactonase [Actinokineospora pegani]|uniref:6-phosphogluconolactonase n=1 Tax=Actinokineospora pegani TaxID=2654637 RepID=UPI0012EACBD5|nr:6-phosphogluconolactonase [Actinokineospora pegani]